MSWRAPWTPTIEPFIVARTLEEQANIKLSLEHFAAESAHDTERTLKTLSDYVLYRVVAGRRCGLRQGGGGEILRRVVDRLSRRRHHDLRMVASGEWIFAENFVTATHLALPRAAA